MPPRVEFLGVDRLHQPAGFGMQQRHQLANLATCDDQIGDRLGWQTHQHHARRTDGETINRH